MSPSLRTSIIRIVASAFPQLVYGYPRTYIVASVHDDYRLDLVPPPDAPHLPELKNVEQWTLGGALAKPKTGAECVVIFRDKSPTRPIVSGFAPGQVDLLDFDNGTESLTPGQETGRVVRYGETIMFPSGAAAIPTALPILGSAHAATGAPAPPVVVSRVKA